MENSNYEFGKERISVDLMGLLRSLLKKSGVILITTAVFAAAVFAVSKNLEVISYKSMTRILIGNKADIDSCVRIVKSHYVLNRASEMLPADFEANVSHLKKVCSASRVKDTRMIEISALAPVPEEAEETAIIVRDIAIGRINELMYRPDEVKDPSEEKDKGMISDGGIVEIVDDTGEPEVIKNINIKKNVVLSALLAFIAQSVFLIFKFLLHESGCPVKRPDDVECYLNEEVLAVIPEKKALAGKKIKIEGSENPLCLYVGENDARGKEAFRFLRTNLTAFSKGGKVFCFTGTFDGDGTSSVAFYTAKAFADADKKVLYVDANIRKASGGVKNAFPGLCGVMDGEAAFDDAVLKTEYKGLHVLNSGDVSKACGEMFLSQGFKAMLEKCRNNYDYVIFNTPPARSFVDFAIIGKECDGTVYVIKSDAVSRALARTLLEQMKRTGCTVSGTVLTGADMKNDRYYGKYYYSYKETAPVWAKLIKRR